LEIQGAIHRFVLSGKRLRYCARKHCCADNKNSEWLKIFHTWSLD